MLKRIFQHPLMARTVGLYLRLRFKYRVIGLAHAHAAIASGHGVLLAGNHTGLLDSVLVTAAYPAPLTFLMREEVTQWPYVGKLVAHANTLILWQAHMTRQLRACIEGLKSGQHCVIFPEGQLTEDGGVGTFNEGVGMLWHKGHAVLLPFVIHGGYAAWKNGAKHATGGVLLVIQFLPPLMPQQASVCRKTIAQTLQTQIAQALAQGPQTDIHP
jgi:1-acyl-sn-glycerol-3-phosphate acyltransferase